MQRLTVSDEVFSRLRALSQSAELSEDHILRHLLDGAPETATGNHPNRKAEDFEDATYGIIFPEGFEIFRIYKGRPYTARVVRGRWQLDGDARPYDSLNQLSQAVIDGNENAWMFWFTRRPDGTGKRIAELRDPALVQKRPRRKRRRGWVEKTDAAAQPVPETAVSQVAAGSGPGTKPRRKPIAAPSPAQSPGGGRAWEPK